MVAAGMTVRAVWIGLWLLLVWPLITPAAAQNRIDIVLIYTRFLSSRFAALGCHGTSEATEVGFLSNFMTVKIRAGIALKERNPGATESQIKTRMDAAEEQIKTLINNEIATNGCASPRIQEQLALYKLHASMSL